MNVWGELSAEAIGNVIHLFRTTEVPGAEEVPGIENVSKVVRIIITEKTILGHNITEIAKYVPTEEVFHATRISTSVASETLSLDRSASNGFELERATLPFGWTLCISVLCLLSLFALIGLCLGFLRYRRHLSVVNLAQYSFLPLFRNSNKGNDASNSIQHHAAPLTTCHNTRRLRFHQASQALQIASGKLPRFFKSRLFTFIGGLIVCHVGYMTFDPLNANKVEVLAGFVGTVWNLLTGLFYLLRQRGGVAHQWLQPVEQIMFVALFWLKSHWLLVLGLVGLMILVTAAVMKWRSMDWRDRQAKWYRFLWVCLHFWATLGYAWEDHSPKLVDLVRWCWAHDFRCIFIGIAKLAVEILLLIPQGFYKLHHRVRESQRQKIIDVMAAAHKATCRDHGIEIGKKDDEIDRQILQITVKDQVIADVGKDRDKYKGKYEEATGVEQGILEHCQQEITGVRTEAGWRIKAATTEYAWNRRTYRGSITCPLGGQMKEQNTDSGESSQRISSLETKLQHANAAANDNTSKISDLEQANASLLAQLREKDQVPSTQPTQASVPGEDIASATAELQGTIKSLRVQLGEKYREIDSFCKLLKEKDETIAGMAEVAANSMPKITSFDQISSVDLKAIYDHFFAGEVEELEAKHNREVDELKALNASQAEDLAKFRSKSPSTPGNDAKLQQLQTSFNQLKKEFNKLKTKSEREKKQSEEWLENTRTATSKALQEKAKFEEELKSLRAAPPPSMPARMAYINTFSDGTSNVQRCRGATRGFQALISSLRQQHHITDITLADLKEISDYPLNAAKIAAARKEEPTDIQYDFDPRQLAVVLELWGLRNFGKIAVLGIRSKMFKEEGFCSYQILGDEAGEIVVWIERVIPKTDTQMPSMGGFGVKPPAEASGSAAQP
ncbi:MAG: hypothetical protein Q9168_005321 [Polycauliona sp. 1 TL-2023]